MATHQRGKLVVLSMFALAIALGAYAWWHQLHENSRSKLFWGTSANLIIQRAPTVEFFELQPVTDHVAQEPAPGPRIVVVDQASYALVPRDLSKAPGLIHARHALIDDNSYDWSSSKRSCQPTWNFGLRFGDGSAQVTVLFDTVCESVRWLEANKTAQLIPETAKAFQKKRKEWGR